MKVIHSNTDDITLTLDIKNLCGIDMSIDQFDYFAITVYTTDYSIEPLFTLDNIETNVIYIGEEILTELEDGQLSLAIHYSFTDINCSDEQRDITVYKHTNYYVDNSSYIASNKYYPTEFSKITGNVEDNQKLVNYIQAYIITDGDTTIVDGILEDIQDIKDQLEDIEIPDVPDAYTKTQTYNKTEIDTKISNLLEQIDSIDEPVLPDGTQTYNKTDIDTKISNLQEQIDDIEIPDAYTKDETYSKTELSELLSNDNSNTGRLDKTILYLINNMKLKYPDIDTTYNTSLYNKECMYAILLGMKSFVSILNGSEYEQNQEQ